MTAEECMLCAHCYAVCPHGAIRFNPELLRGPIFTTFTPVETPRVKDTTDPADIVHFIRSRRSVRRYRDTPLEDDTISDLVEFAVTAPSGSNRQDWRFLVLNSREKVWDLALEIRNFFIRLNRLAGNPFIRWCSLPFAGTALIRYHRDHMASVEKGLREAEGGRDLLFHGAPAVIIIHGPREGSTPVEDAQFASYHIALLAHALGLGTCHIGYAVESINRSGRIRRRLGIPDNGRVHAVMTVGHPDIKFERPALRKHFDLRYL